jgi:hypothetical protein
LIRNIKERVIGAAGSLSGIASILGSWQACHSVCLALVGFLSILGITVVGMPLVFLTEVAIPVWTVAVILLTIAAILYVRKGCISSRLLLVNLGLVIAGIPFPLLQRFTEIFWMIGGALVITGIFLFVKDKIHKHKETSLDTEARSMK